jgi:predicted HicB family RNase H-like nuclease
MPEITDEDRERVRLLQIVTSSKHEFKKLSLEELKRLQELVEKKDYSHNKKAHKSKVKLLGKINVRIYELTEGKGIWD